MNPILSKSNKLKEVVFAVTGHSVDCKSRKHDHVFSRMIYSKILNEHGLGPSAICRTLNKDHSTIIHYLDEFGPLCISKPYVREWYNSARSMFNFSSSNLATISRSEMIQNYLKVVSSVAEVRSVLKSFRDQIPDEVAGEFLRAISMSEGLVSNGEGEIRVGCCKSCGSKNINDSIKGSLFCFSCGEKLATTF